MSHKGRSTKNAQRGRFWRTLKFEGFYLAFPKTMVELKSMEVLKMAESQTYGYVDNSDEVPTRPFKEVCNLATLL